jgi:hypothetical protein
VEILQVAMTIDEARQNALAFYLDHFGAGGNSDFAAPADGLKPACLDDDDAIVDRRPAGAVDQFSSAHDERFLCHVSFPPLNHGQRSFNTIYYFDALSANGLNPRRFDSALRCLMRRTGVPVLVVKACVSPDTRFKSACKKMFDGGTLA